MCCLIVILDFVEEVDLFFGELDVGFFLIGMMFDELVLLVLFVVYLSDLDFGNFYVFELRFYGFVDFDFVGIDVDGECYDVVVVM